MSLNENPYRRLLTGGIQEVSGSHQDRLGVSKEREKSNLGVAAMMSGPLGRDW